MLPRQSISFVIPVYNAESTVRDSINSIIDTNFSHGDEIITVNDKSTDNSLMILEEISSEYSFIKIVNNHKNIGCPASRNAGIKIAKNDLIFNLDSDNILAPNTILPLKQLLIKKGADIAAFSEIHFFKDDDKSVTHKWIFDHDELLFADILFSHTNPAPAGNFLFKKSSWEDVGGYFEYGKGLHEAWGFSLKMLASGKVFKILRSSHYLHRYGHDSLYIRESKLTRSLPVETKLISNYKELLHEGELDYILRNPLWFDSLEFRPIRTKANQVARSGLVVYAKESISDSFGLIRLVTSRTIKLFNPLIEYYKTIKDFIKFNSLSTKNKAKWQHRKIIINENTPLTKFDSHYIMFPAWAIRTVKQLNPRLHIDISSTLHFCTTISSIVPTEFYDFRPAKIDLPNLSCAKADLTKLQFASNSIESISCMHVVEHIGLGRYGDPIDPKGDLKAISELQRVVAPNGHLLLVVPLGKDRIVFNAHRIYSHDTILSLFKSGFELVDFSLIVDKNETAKIIQFPSDVELNDINYGCGCYCFRKK